jgi:hypothetical protein
LAIDPVTDFVQAVWDGILSFGEAEEMANSPYNLADSCGGKAGASCNQQKGGKDIIDYEGKKESKKIRKRRAKWWEH